MRLPFLLPTMLVLAACTGAGSEGASPAPDPRPPRAAEATRISGAMSPMADSLRRDTAAVRFDAEGHPVMPIVLRDYCEGEDCGTHFAAIACLPTGLREAPSDSAKIIVPLAPGDSAKVVRRDLRVLSPGVVIVRNDFVLDQDEGDEGPEKYPRADTVHFARGDTVYLISYLALGRWSWALHSRLHDSSEFWAAAPEGGLGGAGSDSTQAVARSTPATEDWWLVQTRGGTSGWWHGDGHQELQSIWQMEHWSDDCDKVRKGAAQDSSSTPGR